MDQNKPMTADELHRASPTFEYFRINSDPIADINLQLAVINDKLRAMAETVRTLKELGEDSQLIAHLTDQYIKVYEFGQEISNKGFQELTRLKQNPSRACTPHLPQFNEIPQHPHNRTESQLSFRPISQQGNGRTQLDSRNDRNEQGNPEGKVHFQPKPGPIVTPQPVRPKSGNIGFGSGRTDEKIPFEINNGGVSGTEALTSALMMSMRLQQDMMAVSSTTPFTDPAKQSPIEFLENFNRAVLGTALTEIDKKRCFTQLIKIPTKKWCPGLTFQHNSLEEFQDAFVGEYFSIDAQMEINDQFISSKAPTKRSALLEYYDTWYEKLASLKKSKREVDEILLELTRKAPGLIQIPLRGNRYHTYEGFR